jgi:hypothetical protein
MKHDITIAILILAAFSLSSCLAGTGGGTAYDPYRSDPYYDGDYRTRREWDRQQREAQRLERERLELERERIRLERERIEAEKHTPSRPVYRPPSGNRDRCPAGFSPSERRCNDKERKRGCKDMRTKSGMGCVSSGFR